MVPKSIFGITRVAGPLILACRFFAVSVAVAAEGLDPAAESNDGPLDGLVFTGEFGPEGEPADRTDTLYFGNGRFWSENCIPCGFPPGIYRVRRADGAIRFQGKLHSPERGTFRYEGVVRGERISVSINWRRERWYWTIDRDFWFRGVLAPDKETGSVRRATRLALGAPPDPARNSTP